MRPGLLRHAVMAVEHWAIDDDSCFIGMAKIAFIIGVVFVALFVTVGGVYAWLFPETAQDRCLNTGRGWAIVGHHTEYAPKTGAYRVTDYGCVEIVR